jgi:aldehyde:ferredoxin oxidoreductase
MTSTGEVYFASQALGLRHSHLDTGGYAYDQKHEDEDVGKAVNFLLADEASRAFLTSMVACLFARGVYNEELLAGCLQAVGYGALAANIKAVSRHIQKLRWQTRLATGFNPAAVAIPKRFTEVTTWKGQVDGEFLARLKDAYGQSILKLAEGEA